MKILEFKEDKLILIDQRKLPLVEEYVECENEIEVSEAIKKMVVRGAPAIGVAAAYGIALSKDPGNAGELLKKSRPTAVDLFNSIEYMLKGIREGRIAKEVAKEWHKKIIEKTKKMSEFGASLIEDGENILLHCNAGPLATGGYGTSIGVVIEAWRTGKKIFIYVDETRPRFQGALTSWELRREGVPHKVIIDSAAGSLLNNGKIDKVIVGADRIVKNGDFANKIGTYPLAVVSNENKVPFYVVAPISSFDFSLENGEGIEIEERDGNEILEVCGNKIYGNGTKVLNLAFDVTPYIYVEKYITEYGIHNKVVEVEEIWKNMKE